jgi:tyrosine-protein kinase Etk/Wzc
MQPVNEIGQEIPLEAGRLAPMEFDLLDLLLILAARKRAIFLATLVGLVLVGVVVFLMHPTYTAEAIIMPPQQEESGTSGLMSQLGALASVAGMGGSLTSSLGIKNPSDLYIGMLKSQSIADGLIKQFNLKQLYHTKTLGGARKVLANNSKFVSGKDGLINISVEDHDPHRAAGMANAYINQLYTLNNRLAITQASQRRVFFGQQLAEEKDQLADAEVALKETEEATGVIAPTGQVETTIRQIAQVQAEITGHEVELDALRTSSTAQNPDVVRLTTELDSLRQQEHDLEAGTKGKHAPGDIAISSAAAPQVGLEYIRKERDVKYHELLFDIIARQYEAARIDEAKAIPVIQVVDPALVPERKSGPHRLLWTLIGGFIGFFFSCVWVTTEHVYQRLESDEMQGRRLAMLRRELSLRE